MHTTTKEPVCEENDCTRSACTFQTDILEFRCIVHHPFSHLGKMVLSGEKDDMHILRNIAKFLFIQELTDYQKGQIYAQEAAKIECYTPHMDALTTLMDAEGIGDHRIYDFLSGVFQEQERLAIKAGRVFCDTCNGYYLPHEH